MDTLIPDVNAAGVLAEKEKKSENGEIKYSKKIIVFLDVLGYSNFVKKQGDKAKEVYDVMEFLSKAFNDVNDSLNVEKPDSLNDVDDSLNGIRPARKGELTLFSDTIVFSFEIKEELEKLKEVLPQLVPLIGVALYRIFDKCELLLRGIITLGEIYHTQNELFGQGIIDAYRKEKEEILFPRVLLDKSVHSGIDFKKVYKTENGTVSIDYIGDYIGSTPDKTPDEKKEIFKKHKKLIEYHLKRKKAKTDIVAKYIWLKDYHNWAVEKHFGNYADKKGLLIVRAAHGRRRARPPRRHADKEGC
jgi:hypothetical protein